MNFVAFVLAFVVLMASIVVASPVNISPRWGGGNQGGIGTFFTQGGNAGACGQVHDDKAFIVALESSRYNSGEHCGKTVHIINLNNWKIVDAVVADECPTCVNSNSIDLSVGAFDALGATVEQGEVPIWWWFA